MAGRAKARDEVGFDASNGNELVRIDPKYFRPTEVDVLLGDPSKAQKELGWRHKVGFQDLVKEMVSADAALLERERWRNTLSE